MLLLVEGTEDTDCDTIDETLPMKEQTFKVTSPNTRCLLSDPAARVTLTGYCDFKKIMQYRLDKETALVLVSAITFEAPEAPCVVSVEHMQKVSRDEAAALTASMTAEWTSILNVPGELESAYWAGEAAYWTPESAWKVRRVQSEPMSPGPASG